MAFTFLTSVSASGLSTVTTAGIDTTGADFLVIGTPIQDPWGGTPTDNKSNTWTEVSNSYTRTNVRVRTFFSIPTSVGTGHTFTIAPDSTPDDPVGCIFVAAFSGAKQSTPEDQINGSNNFSGTIQPGSITPGENNELIISVVGINASGTPISIDSGFTKTSTEINFSAGSNYGGCMAYLIQTAAAAVNPTWTRTGTNGNAAMQVSFKAAPAAAGKFLQLMGVGR